MYSQVLVPTDGSELSQTVLPYAAAIAGKAGVPLTLLRVIDHDFERTPAEEQLLRMVQPYGAKPVVIESGNVVKSIADAVAETPGTLLAMTTHGRSGLGEEILGTVALTVLRRIDQPAIIYRAPSLRVVQDPVAITNVVAPIDTTEFSERILRPAADLAKTLDAGLELVHVVRGDSGAPDGDIVESSYVRSRAASLGDTGLDAGYEVLHGDPAGAIVNYVKDRPGTMLAMASHGRRGLERTIFGSVTAACIRNSGMPVLVLVEHADQ